MRSTPDKTRRPGYAPAENAGVGRRGLHTRARILECAANVFLVNGFHGSSLDTIAKAANASRATVYQYFAGKEDIFRELSAAAERDVLVHGERLSGLGPTADGLDALHRWLAEWADIYDTHAAVFAEFPGIGTSTGLAVIDTGDVAEQYRLEITERLREADLRGLSHHDAAAALGRIPHMVNLYRHRSMFPLPDRAVVSWSMSLALQLMLFPDTSDDALRAATPDDIVESAIPTSSALTQLASAPEVAPDPLPPIAQDVLSVSSTLFAERGYYAVSMEEIAAAAEVSRATLYRYFSTKDLILAELTRAAVLETEAHAAALRRLAAADTLDIEEFSRWTLAYVRFHRAYSGVIRAWFDGTVAERLSDATVSHGIASLHDAVADLLGTMQLPDGMDPATATAVFLATLGRMTEPTPCGETDQHAADVIVDLLCRSLLAQPGGST